MLSSANVHWDRTHDFGREVKSGRVMLEACNLTLLVQVKMECTVYKSHFKIEQYTAYICIPTCLIYMIN